MNNNGERYDFPQEWGIYNAEGLVSDGFYSEQLANEVARTLDDKEVYVSEVKS